MYADYTIYFNLHIFRNWNYILFTLNTPKKNDFLLKLKY